MYVFLEAHQCRERSFIFGAFMGAAAATATGIWHKRTHTQRHNNNTISIKTLIYCIDLRNNLSLRKFIETIMKHLSVSIIL